MMIRIQIIAIVAAAVTIEILIDVTVNYIYWFLFNSLLYHKNKTISSSIAQFGGYIQKGRTSKFLTGRTKISIEEDQ